MEECCFEEFLEGLERLAQYLAHKKALKYVFLE